MGLICNFFLLKVDNGKFCIGYYLSANIEDLGSHKMPQVSSLIEYCLPFQLARVVSCLMYCLMCLPNDRQVLKSNCSFYYKYTLLFIYTLQVVGVI